MEELTLNLEKKKFQCSSGHSWEATSVGEPGFKVYFTMPTGEVVTFGGLCLFCIKETAEALVGQIGKVKQVS